ncbi:MAG: O-antigen ligase family protein [Candidatus Rokubacteria bacterium]|nr:O-antigen ligase family protein [Candidatus Rokubacteria bacterium]
MFGSPPLDRVARGAVYTVLVAAPVALGGRPSWVVPPLEAIVLLGVLAAVLWMLASGRIEWRHTALDRPLTFFVGLVALQLLVGNGRLVSWALGPPAASPDLDPLPTPFLTIGTIAPRTTTASLLLLLACAGVYYLVVHVSRRRRHLEMLVRLAFVAGVALAVVGLVDYFARDSSLVPWTDSGHRVAATFVNPDHFAAWLNMVIFISLGYALALPAGTHGRPGRPLPAASRRYAVFFGITVMAAALFLTLSRGAILSLIVGVATVVVALAMTGAARRMFAMLGALLAGVLIYAVSLGLGPVLSRFEQFGAARRWLIYTSTLPMLKDFPVLGIGLGAYEHISARYQPSALDPGDVLINAAHSDWLQILVELGPLGAVLVVYCVVRLGRDLVGVHLFGRGTCPVGGGAGEWAQRNDPFSVRLALGAIAAVMSLAAHSAVDFSARMPANGMLAAAALGIATVALHTRFGTDDGWLSARATWSPAGQRPVRALRAAAVVVACLAALVILRPLGVESLLALGKTRGLPGALDAASAVDGGDPRLLVARAAAGEQTARRLAPIVTANALASGRPAGGEQFVTAPLHAAVADLRRALEAVPSSSATHERLAWTYQSLWNIERIGAPAHAAAAVTHMHRAIALDPENPFRHRALAGLVIAMFPDAALDAGLAGVRNAVARRPGFLPELIREMEPLPLTDAQWIQAVPDTFVDRLALADALEHRRLVRQAILVYGSALAVGSRPEAPVAHWMLAGVFVRQEDYAGALRELAAALKIDPDNPELRLALAETLDRSREVAALQVYRMALAKAEEMAKAGRGASLFGDIDGRLRAIVSRRFAADGGFSVVRYRRGLARYLVEHGLWPQAIEQTEIARQEAPRDARVHSLHARALEGLGRRDDAVAAHRTAVALDEGNIALRLALANALRHTEQPYQAINEWQSILRREPAHVDAALEIARTYLRAQMRTEAIRAYRYVAKIAPGNEEARRVLARFGWLPP